MKYRKFGRLDWQPSALGFGAMRLPHGDDNADVDQAEAIRMMRHAFDNGVNYVDTAYGYHGGISEVVVGRALKDGYREKVKVATKMPVWLVKTSQDFSRIFSEQLERVQTDHFDFYLIHALNQERWDAMQKLGIIEWMESEIERGRIGYPGFSFHGKLTGFKSIIEAWGKWVFCQIQYNYMNENVQAGTAGLHFAASRGLAVIIMEPILGGKLANPPPQVKEIWDSTSFKRTPADWALQWIWNKPEPSIVLSGMSTMQQVEENLRSADSSGAGCLSQEELEVVERARVKYQKLRPIPCTKCMYCMPCPSGVNIPDNLEMYNFGVMFESMADARFRYKQQKEETRASACTQCLECEQKCPQEIKISEWMLKIHHDLRDIGQSK